MASPVVELKGHVHIAPCGRDRCQRKIKELSEALEKKGVICITENDYGLGGSFANRFCQAFEGCQFTVIHKCRRLWKKISSFEDTLLKEHEKVIAVILNDEMKIKQDEREAGKSSSFYKFFNHTFHTRNAVDEKSFKTLVERLQSECGVSGLDTTGARDGKSHTQDTSTPTSISDNTELKQQYSPNETDDASETVEKKSFVEYQNMLMHSGRPTLYINKSCLQFTQDQVLNKFSDTVPSSCIEALSHMNNLASASKEEQLSILIQILYQVLPQCYREHNIVGVTCIACCDSLVLQLEATRFLVLMLLSREDEGRQLSITTLCLMESLIYWMILRTCERCKKSEDSSIVAALNNLSTLYMMIVSEMVLTCRGNEERLCNVQLGTIAARPSPDNAKYPVVIKSDLKKFIQDISNKDSSHWKNTGERFLTDNPSAQGKALAKKSLATQVIMVYQVLKKLFKSRDGQHLIFLHDFIEAKAPGAAEGNKNPDSCIMILVQGMTLFLTVGLKKAVDQDLGTVCDKCLKAVRMFPKWTLTVEMRDSIETLYFVHNPRIRKLMIEYPVGEKEEQHWDFVYEQDQLKFLVNRMEKLLSPFLSALDDPSSNGGEECKGSWSLMSGKFDQEEALLQFHHPTPKDHKKFNKTKFTNGEDMYHNEMTVLQELQHKNIIKLLAYQATIIPQFYIVENYKIRNLQTTLKNKRKNQETFDQTTLLQYLLDAASAVEYCHREGYAHCNLNCASLFIAKDKSVKLSCFHLCLKLIDGKRRADAHLNQLPVRWTAPESIRESEFSRASDVWMFGHLIFETLSHGLLPYEQFDDPLVLGTKIIKELVPFAHEDYISKEHLDLMYDCKKMDCSQRITIEEVKTQLQGFYTDAQKSGGGENDYPADTGEFKPSTGHEMGIPDVNIEEDDKEGDEEQSATAFPLSDTMMLLKNGQNNCFREKIVFKLPPEMINKVKGGELRDIFPKVKVEQIRFEAPHIVCEIPSSCQGSLYDVAARRSLGDELGEYMKCLYQTAVMMDQLHRRSWVLGDISAAYLYVEHRNNNIQVYVVSLAYLRPLEINFQDIPSEEPLVRLRAAPEVVNGGAFSPATDVYCFGNLMWEVLQAFDDGMEYVERFCDMENSTPKNDYMKKISESWETSHAKPICCPDDLYDLMKSCVHSHYKERIKTEQLVEKLNRFTVEETAVKTV